MNICMPDVEYLRKLVEEEPSKIYKQAERKILFCKNAFISLGSDT